MTVVRSLLIASALSLAATSVFAVDATTQANAEAVNAACSADASTTGCSDKTVGTGLLKCMADYKKAHPEFKFSEGCKTATAKGVSDYKESHPPTAPDPTTQANAAAVNAACSADASTTGCSGKTVGTGLINCMADYKKAHPEFKFSTGCTAATAKGVSDYKASHPPATTP